MLNQFSITFTRSPVVGLLVETQSHPSHIRGSTKTVLTSKSADDYDRYTKLSEAVAGGTTTLNSEVLK